MLDFFNSMDVKRGISPAAAVTDNTPFVSQIIDLQNCKGAVLVLEAGVEADADVTFATTVVVGDDPALADGVAATAAQLLGTTALASFTFANDNQVFKIGVKGGYRRYAQVTVTPQNNTGSAFVSGPWVRFSNLVPTANPPV